MAQTKIWDGTKWVDYIMSSQIKLPLGSIGFSLDGILPEGAIAATGLELSREVYKDLWGFAQKGGETRLISEEAWQAELAANEGRFCRYYSTGNGATTFRIPYIACYLSGTAEAEKVGTYVTDTQRNITGQFSTYRTSWDGGTGELLFGANGAFGKIETGNNMDSIHQESSDRQQQIVDFDASRSVGATHTGEEVKPKTAYVLYYIQAFSTIINSGTLDINDLVGDVSDLTLNHQIKSFTDLSQIGLIKGTETLKSIGEALPENSQISYQIEIGSGHNSIEYPQIKGYFNMKKDTTYCYCVFATESNTKMFQRSFDYRDAFYIDANWSVMADNNKLSMPSNNKIIINLKNQGDSWTAPCDGYIWGMKVGGSNVVNSWLNVWDSTNADTTNYGTLIYCDYGQPYINLCGNLAIRKGQTVYFNWSNNCRVYFYPVLNANMPTYGEDVRIYFKAVDSNNNIISGAPFKISIADSSGDIVILSGKTSSDGRYLVPEDKWLSLTGLEDNQLITCTMTKGNATGSAEYRISLFKENMIYDLPITLVEGGGVIHNIDLELAVSGQIRCNKTSGDGNTQAYAGDEIILTAVPDVGVEFLNWQIINLTTLEKEIKIENPLTYIMPDSDIRVAADFNDDPIDIPIDPSSPSPAVDVYFKVLTNGTTTMGYNVTLYSPKGNVIWQGVTNSQGYVQLDPTLSFYAEDGMTLRAMKGSKFTQITVNKDSFSTDKADSNNAIWFTLTVGEMG